MTADQTWKEVGHYNVLVYPPLSTVGAFGTVFEAYHKETGEKAAVKCIKFREKDGSKNDYMATMGFKEIKSTQCFKNHKHIIQFLDYNMDQYSYWLFMEFCELGNLADYLKSKPSIPLQSKVDIMHQISDAIAFMHGHNTPLVHRDIKLENVLMTREGGKDVVKVSDFGFAKLYEDQVRAVAKSIIQGIWLNSLVGTRYYMAPEFFLEEETGLRYDASVDIFALGLVFSVVLNFCKDADTVPRSVEALKADHFVSIGYEMVKCYNDGKPLPRITEIKESDEDMVKKLKVLIDSMVQFSCAGRKPVDEVEGELSEMVERLNGDENRDLPDEPSPKESDSSDFNDDPGYKMMQEFSKERRLIDRYRAKTYENHSEASQDQVVLQLQESVSRETGSRTIAKYDLVVLINDVEELKKLQVGFGGFHPDMQQCLGQRGLVTGLSVKGVRVDLLTCQCFIFNPQAMRVIGSNEQTIEAGDYVIVKPEAEVVKYIQQQPGNGGWREEMSRVIGKIGLVRYVRGNQVSVEHLNTNDTFIWSRKSLALISKAEDMIAELLKSP